MFKLTTVAAFFASATADDKCLLPVDVMILQDTTGSFVDDLPNVRLVLPGLIDKILIQNPGSWFGAAEFKDKPYRDLGEPDDFCYKLRASLTADKDEVCASYEKMFASGGGDTPEAMLQSLANLATDPAVKWRSLSDGFRTQSMDLSHNTGARLVIMSTDANPHDPKDYELYNGSIPDFPPSEQPIPPMSMTPYPNNPTGISTDEQCKTYAYPEMDQVVKLLKDEKINVVFLVPQPNQASMTPYDYDASVKAVEAWTEMNKKLGQPASFFQYISADSSNLESVVLTAMAEVSDYICNETTTTPVPVTTQAPTQTTPTTTTPAPVTTTAAPVTTTVAPVTTTPAPVTTTAAPVTTTPAPVTTTAAPVTTTAAPVTTTAAPVTTTAAPVTTTASASTLPATTTTYPVTPSSDLATTTGTSGPCPCPHPCPAPGPCEVCPCPEVVIKLRHRPQKMHFDLANREAN